MEMREKAPEEVSDFLSSTDERFARRIRFRSITHLRWTSTAFRACPAARPAPPPDCERFPRRVLAPKTVAHAKSMGKRGGFSTHETYLFGLELVSELLRQGLRLRYPCRVRRAQVLDLHQVLRGSHGVSSWTFGRLGRFFVTFARGRTFRCRRRPRRRFPNPPASSSSFSAPPLSGSLDSCERYFA